MTAENPLPLFHQIEDIAPAFEDANPRRRKPTEPICDRRSKAVIAAVGIADPD